MQETGFLDGTGAVPAGDDAAVAVAVAVAGGDGAVGAHGAGGRQVRDVFREGVLGADGGDAAFGGFARFGEGVVARVEVFALLGRAGEG